jgi:inorganic triphosphatase YgiF
MDFFRKHWGDLASVLGFALTIWFAWSAKNAAEQARDAANDVRDQISRFDTIADLSAAITIIEEIMRLQRTQAWEIVWDIVLDRYATLQSHLSRSKGGAGLTEAHRTSIQTAIARFRIMVEGIEKARTEQEQEQLVTAVLNRKASEQASVLESIRTAVKKAGT